MAEASNTGGDGQITFKVKCSGDKNHTVTIAESATVLQLKTLLAGEEYENISPEQQRLIYSGKVMKDDEVLSSYKIKHMNTVHMVKRPAGAATASSGSTSTPAQPAIPHNMAAGTPSNNLLAGLTGARFAGQVPLPSRDLFGPDGGVRHPFLGLLDHLHTCLLIMFYRWARLLARMKSRTCSRTQRWPRL